MEGEKNKVTWTFFITSRWKLNLRNRQLEELSKKTQDYETLLETLGGMVGSSVADRIRILLEKVCRSGTSNWLRGN
jgi:hypothetical protein